MKTIPAIDARIALLAALQQIAAGYIAATSNAERAAFVLALERAYDALEALE